ncbi:MAG TPA: hypothetical protein VEL76_42920 [Gemmataceae bacterium]|nr:hypothetical protein [Gemmataceae bacterium]
MAGKRGCWGVLVVVLGFLAQEPASAGPYLGDWGWFWHQAPGCPRGNYSPLHYWAPQIYRARAFLHPSNLDQYPPGPCPPVPPTFQFSRERCRTLPPMPTAPYADPTTYYGRAIAPE